MVLALSVTLPPNASAPGFAAPSSCASSRPDCSSGSGSRMQSACGSCCTPPTIYPARASARPAAACRASLPTTANRFVCFMLSSPLFRCAPSYAVGQKCVRGSLATPPVKTGYRNAYGRFCTPKSNDSSALSCAPRSGRCGGSPCGWCRPAPEWTCAPAGCAGWP